MEEFEDDIVGDELLASIDLGHSPPSRHLQSLPAYIEATRSDFPGFPFATPYPQQVDLMRALYGTLAARRCGIFESPTGTGKSLTLLTASLHWLLDHQETVNKHIQLLQSLLKTPDASKDEATEACGDWVVSQSRQRARRLQIVKEMEPLEVKSRASNMAAKLAKQAAENSHRIKSQKCVSTKPSREYVTLLPDSSTSPLEDPDYFNNDSNESKFLTSCNESLRQRSVAFDAEHDGDPVVGENDDVRVTQIIYCSRTHSQLAQIGEELKKMEVFSANVTTLTLASRQFLCVNEPIFALKNQSQIRDACLDLVGKSPGCKYRGSGAVQELSEHLLGSRMPAMQAAGVIRDGGDDIEEIPVHACPYYANRRGIPLAQMVLAPYQTVVVPTSRQAAGLTLRDNVLIFDEAHNLLEAVAAAFAVTISHVELVSAQRLLETYCTHYRARLSAISMLRLRQLLQVTRSCIQLLEGAVGEGLDAQRRQRLENVQNLKPGRKTSEEDCGDNHESVYSVANWLFITGLDHINVSYLVDYLRTDLCAQKIAGFGKWIGGRRSRQKKAAPKDATPSAVDVSRSGSGLSLSDCFEKLKRQPPKPKEEPPKSKRSRLDKDSSTATVRPPEPPPNRDDLETAGSSLFALLAFLEALVAAEGGEDDGRLIVKPSASTSTHLDKEKTDPTTILALDGQIRFMILNPGRYLQDVVREARSVILVGGTMKPFDEFLEQIFRPAGKSDADVCLFSCGHVIDTRHQLRIYTPALSPKGITWDFTFRNRNNVRLMNECGEFLIEICKMVPGGLVVFFPSFDYLSMVWAHWKSTGLLSRFQDVKVMFKEPRKSTALAHVMQDYTNAINETTDRKKNKNRRQGACIACVMGGKLSEGINFNDDLARGVVIIGLPYPNVHSAAMREKMAFLDRRFSSGGRNGRSTDATTSLTQAVGGAGQRACVAACMRLVNQAIGRAIRHAGDFAVIFLLDARYSRRQVLDQLPVWAHDSILPSQSPTNKLRSDLEAFFARNYQR